MSKIDTNIYTKLVRIMKDSTLEYYNMRLVLGLEYYVSEKERLGKEVTLFNVFRESRNFDVVGDGSCIKACKYIQQNIRSDFEKLPRHIIEVKSLSELNSVKLVK